MEPLKQLALAGTDRDLYRFYINMINEAFSLTKREIDILESILVIRTKLAKSVIDKTLLNRLLFSVESKEEIAELAELTDRKSLDMNYIPSLKKKGVILEKDNIKELNNAFIITPTIGSDYKINIKFNVRSQNRQASDGDSKKA
jgi:hypothetical protein